MAGTQPSGRVPDDAAEDLTGPSRWWWWLVVVAVAAVVVLLVVQPWTEHETEPAATDTASGQSSSASDVPSPTTTGATSSSTTPPALPGSDAVFDGTTLATLFVTDDQLVATVPAASSGVQPGIGPGEVAWGLPAGSSVDPASCTTAVTVVSKKPKQFDARSSGNDAMTWQERVTVLSTATAAQKAFSDLVATVDACPAYSQVNPGSAGDSWSAQPAIEGQSAYPSIVQEVTATRDGTAVPEYHGHLLVGNAIVTWTASALTPGDQTAALATLGDASTLDAMVQDRAQLAVAAVG